MKHFKLHWKGILIVLLCAAFIILPFIALRLSPVRQPMLNSSLPWRFGHRLSRMHTRLRTRSEGEAEKLENVLRRAAMLDRTVIITTLNQAWAAQNTMIDLFLESFKIGEGTSKFLDHLIIVALDQKAYTRCILLHTYCYSLKTDGVDFSGEKLFMTADYLRMMWRRIDFLREVLEEGYSFWFTDADIMWFRDPIPHLSPEADFQIACDHFTGHPTSLENRPNGGFSFARSNKRTIEFYKYWYMSRVNYPNKHDQGVLNDIKYDEALMEIGVRISFLDTTYFAGFCEGGEDMEKVCTMHANCCLGLTSKLHDLRQVLSDWKKYKSMTPQEKWVQMISWSVPRECSLKFQ